MMIDSDGALVRFHEGCTLTAKPDAKGMWSIGWGHDIPAPLPGAEPAACTQEQADAWVAADVDLARTRARAAFQNMNGAARWEDLDLVRQAVLVDMAYELGGAGLREFKDMLQAVYLGRWGAAAAAMLESLWAKQVPSRAKLDSDMMLTGDWPQA